MWYNVSSICGLVDRIFCCLCPPIKWKMQMNNTLTLTIRANTAALQTALKTAQASVKTFTKSIGKNMSNNAADMRDAFNTAGKSIESTIKRVGAVAIGGSFGVATFVKSASELQSLRASFQSLTGTIENTNSVMNTLYQYGKETAFDNKSIQASAKMFLANGVAVKDLMGWMRNLGDIAGATGANLQGLALPITQAIGTGKVMTQDWYQIINQGAGGLQKYIIAALGAGHSVKTFKDDLEKGRVTVDVMRRALQLASAEGGMAFQGALKQSQTFSGRMSNLQETITNVGLSILGVDAATGQVKVGGVFDRISGAVEDATKWLEENQDKILEVARVIKSNLIPAVTALGGAWAVMKIGAGINGAIKRVDDFKKATDGAVSTFKLLNVAITGNPFGLVVAAIAIVVSALIYLQMKFDIFGKAAEWIKNTWSNALSAIGGWLDGLKKVVGDVYNSVAKWIEDNKTWLINLGIIIGTILLPKIVQIGIKGAIAFGKMMVSGAGVIKNFAVMAARATVSSAKMAVSGTVAFAKWIAGSVLMGAKAAASFAMMGAKALIAGAKIAAAWFMAMGPIGAIVAAVVGLVALVIANWDTVKKWLDAFWKWFSGIAKAVIDSVAGFFKGIWNAVVGVFNAIVGFLKKWGLTILAIVFWPISLVIGLFFTFKAQIFAVFQAIRDFIVAVFTPIGEFFTAVVSDVTAAFVAIGQFIIGVFQAAWDGIVIAWKTAIGFFNSVWNGIVAVFSVVAGWFGGVFNVAWNAIVAVWNVAVGFFSGVWGGIVSVFSAVAEWFAGIFQSAWEGIKKVFSGVAGFFRGVWDTIVNIFTSVGTAVGNAISGAVKGVVNSILGFAENTINGFIKAINVAVGVINAIPGVNIPKLNMLNIPRLATGGIVSPQGGGSIIYAGDGGQNEWVVPESKMSSLVRQINARGGTGVAGGVNITVNVTTRDEKFTDNDAVDIAQKINRALKAQGLRLDQMGALR